MSTFLNIGTPRRHPTKIMGCTTSHWDMFCCCLPNSFIPLQQNSPLHVSTSLASIHYISHYITHHYNISLLHKPFKFSFKAKCPKLMSSASLRAFVQASEVLSFVLTAGLEESCAFIQFTAKHDCVSSTCCFYISCSEMFWNTWLSSGRTHVVSVEFHSHHH